jgi:hypothetical protein
MKRSRFWMIAGTILGLGIALAAQPTSSHSDRIDASMARPAKQWVPGTPLPMPAFESGLEALPPPR